MDLTIECDNLPQKGETVSGHGFITNPGGKGGNQAVSASKLGAKTYMIASVGNDIFGKNICESLLSYNVNIDHVSVTEKFSSGVAVITRSEGDNRIILSEGANGFLNELDVKKALDEISEPGDIFVAQFECDYQTTHKALQIAKEKGLFTIFNPAPAKKIDSESFKDIDLIVVNQTECEFLTGIYPKDMDTCELALNKFKELGVKNSILTLGEKGSVTLVNNQIVFVPSCKVENVDTTAAGDCYIGAIARGISLGETISEAMKFATKAAALAITKCGAQQSLPYLQDIQEYFKEAL